MRLNIAKISGGRHGIALSAEKPTTGPIRSNKIIASLPLSLPFALAITIIILHANPLISVDEAASPPPLLKQGHPHDTLGDVRQPWNDESPPPLDPMQLTV